MKTFYRIKVFLLSLKGRFSHECWYPGENSGPPYKGGEEFERLAGWVHRDWIPEAPAVIGK